MPTSTLCDFDCSTGARSGTFVCVCQREREKTSDNLQIGSLVTRVFCRSCASPSEHGRLRGTTCLKHNFLPDFIDYFRNFFFSSVCLNLNPPRAARADTDTHLQLNTHALPHNTDGLRDASTIKQIHLKSLAVISRKKPAAGSRCSPRRSDCSAPCHPSWGHSGCDRALS